MPFTHDVRANHANIGQSKKRFGISASEGSHFGELIDEVAGGARRRQYAVEFEASLAAGLNYVSRQFFF